MPPVPRVGGIRAAQPAKIFAGGVPPTRKKSNAGKPAAKKGHAAAARSGSASLPPKKKCNSQCGISAGRCRPCPAVKDRCRSGNVVPATAMLSRSAMKDRCSSGYAIPARHVITQVNNFFYVNAKAKRRDKRSIGSDSPLRTSLPSPRPPVPPSSSLAKGQNFRRTYPPYTVLSGHEKKKQSTPVPGGFGRYHQHERTIHPQEGRRPG